MTRKKSLKKSKTRFKKHRAPCKRTKYSCSKSGGMWGNRRKPHPSLAYKPKGRKSKGGKSKKCKGGKRKKTKRRSSKRGG